MNIISKPIEFTGYTVPQDGTKFALLKQQIECVCGESDEFDLALFGFTEPGSNIRELYYSVPEGHTDFQELLIKYPDCRIIRMLAHEPILSTTERLMVDRGILRLESFMSNQLVRFHDELFLDRMGLPVFAKNKLSLSGNIPDQDLRIPPCGAELQIGEAEPVLAFATKHT
jgi:hypothetical protein